LHTPHENALRKLPQPTILALAESLRTVASAKIAAGYVPTAREAQIMEQSKKFFATNRSQK
jgi:hypothetical protein